jgi:hypothetical protein
MSELNPHSSTSNPHTHIDSQYSEFDIDLGNSDFTLNATLNPCTVQGAYSISVTGIDHVTIEGESHHHIAPSISLSHTSLDTNEFDVIEIDGVKFSSEFFKTMTCPPTDKVFQLEKYDNGVRFIDSKSNKDDQSRIVRLSEIVSQERERREEIEIQMKVLKMENEALKSNSSKKQIDTPEIHLY